MDTSGTLPGRADADRARAAREAEARGLLLDLADVDLAPPPWRPRPVPPSAVDLLQLAVWWFARRAGGARDGGPSGHPADTPADLGRDHPAPDAAAPDASAWGAAAGDAGDHARAARAALTLLPAARDELDGLEAAVLFTARAAGLTWAQMAAALGMNSPQACQQRFDRLTGRRGRSAEVR